MATATITEAWLKKFKLPEGETRARIFDTALPGFGVVVGARTRTFIVRARLDAIDPKTGKPKIDRKTGKPKTDPATGEPLKEQCDVKIGTWGEPGAGDEHGDLWTEPRARRQAMLVLGQASQRIDPRAATHASKDGYTLREGVEAHLARMRAKNRAARSIQTFEHETGKYLADWLDAPINDLDCDAILAHVKANVTARRGSVNPKGAMIGNRVLAHVSASWRSLNRKLKGKLGSWNPAASTDKTKYIPSRKVVEDLPDWAARVATMRSPIRRDGLHLALYTGLRHEDVRTIRVEHVSFEERTVRLPDPKGGPDKAFTIPLSKTVLEILRRRVRDNARDLGADPDGWVFPALDLEGNVGAISNLREKARDGDERFPREDVHTLRRTWESIAQEEGVSELDQHVLSNHTFASHNVNATYIKQHIDHLAKCAALIDVGITRRLNAATPSKKRGPRRAAR